MSKKKSGGKKGGQGPDHHDAEILLRLYELRRETELRKARDWVAFQFRPASVDDVLAVLRDAGKTEQNRWLRQFMSYYEMVASLVHRGVLDRDLLEDSVNEYIGFYVLMKPFLKPIREAMWLPSFMKNIERLVEESPRARAHAAMIEKWLSRRR
ncbi:MAG TPA: hypothetical protein VKW06_14760 [Candidatus Angelobacter sp.]|nr:hypothetical protein [Candidatus Angelobacter sp.]